MNATAESPLRDRQGQGPLPSGRSPAPSDPWKSEWIPPPADELADRHARARQRERDLARRGGVRAGSTVQRAEVSPPTAVPALAPPLATEPRADQARPAEKGRWRRRVAASIATLTTAYWYYAITTLAIALIVPLMIGWSSSTLLTGSMEPLLAPGDVVAFSDYDGQGLDVGTIVRFDDPARPGETLTHRVVGVNPDGTYVTQGDANQQPDSTPLHAASITGVARFVTPHAGLPTLWLITERYGLLAIWAAITALALVMMAWLHHVESASGPRHGKSMLRPVLASILIAALAGLGVAGLTRAAFASDDANQGNQFSAAATFDPTGHLAPVGAAACSNGAQSRILLTGSVPAGSRLIIVVALRDVNGSAPFSASDPAGNVYSVDATAARGTQAQAAILSTHVTTGLILGDEIRVQHPKATGGSVTLHEFLGLTNQAPVAAAGSDGFGTPLVTVAVPSSDTVAVGAVAASGTATTYANPADWESLGPDDPLGCDPSLIAGAGRRFLPDVSDVTYDPTLDAATEWAAVVVAYRKG